MIQPPPRGEPYPWRMPPVYEQWQRIRFGARVAMVLIPLAVIASVVAASPTAGAALGVLIVGSALATVVYVKNRSDRHNAAIDRGEIRIVDDPQLQNRSQVDPETEARLSALGYPTGDIGRVRRFDGGWVIKRRNRTELAIVIGDDGGHAYFDSRKVADVWAASEYRAGRGRDPAS